MHFAKSNLQSFVEDLSSQSLQILGSTCGFSAEELRRAFDEAKLGSVSQFNDTGGCTYQLIE
jgi:hypothetical protein